MLVTTDQWSLPVGTYQATITFTNSDLPGEMIEISVRINVANHEVFLPLMTK